MFPENLAFSDCLWPTHCKVHACLGVSLEPEEAEVQGWLCPEEEESRDSLTSCQVSSLVFTFFCFVLKFP